MIINGNLNAFGLDISDKSVKAVQLEQRRTFRGKKQLFLRAFGEIKIPKGVIFNGEIKDANKLAPAISQLLKNTKIKNHAVVASLPEKKSFLKLLEIKAKNERNLNEGLPKIIESHLPVSYKEIYADWQIISHRDDSMSRHYKVLVGAASRKSVDSLTNFLESLRLIPMALEIEGVAIARSVLGPSKPLPNKKILNHAIVNIGATSSNLIFAQNNIPALSLTLPTPENSAKIDDIVKKINKALSFYISSDDKNKLSGICMGGEGMDLSKLNTLLSQKLGIKIKTCGSLTGIITKNTAFQKESTKYATAIGLAIRGAISQFL
ncbi:MAG: pilus assembly protein PilM [Patescibacteria group bacterium]|nr:pilus assembly protein PilM [Patescibacteria group bacterium]